MEDNRFSLLEMDRGPRAPVPTPTADEPPQLDLVDNPRDLRCVDCGESVFALNDNGVCEQCWSYRTEGTPDGETQADFGGIAAESTANAGQTGMAALGARGLSSLGVGFETNEGYVEAMRRGAPRTTLDQYAQTVGATVEYAADGAHVTLKDGQKFVAQVLEMLAGDGAAEVDSHASDAGIALLKQKTAARKAAEAKVKADLDGQAPLAMGEVTSNESVVLRHGDLVAGAAAEGHGVLVGWNGRGPLTHARLCELAVAAGLPEDVMPSPREVATQARRAVKAFAGAELVFYTEDRGRKWRLERPVSSAKPGEKSGDVAIVVTLEGNIVKCEGDETLSVQIEAEFKRLVADGLHQSTDISRWLVDDVLRGHLSAAKYGGNWYVPRRHRAIAERVVSTFDGEWGCDWMNPALPVATSAQLAQGLARGLAEEIAEIVAESAEARAEAQGKGKDDLGKTKAAGLLLKLRAATERVIAYGQLLGERLVADCREAIRAETVKLDEVTNDGISERFAAVWDEIEYDIKRNGGVL